MRELNYDDGYADGYKDALLFAIQTIKKYGNRAEAIISITASKK